MSQGNPPSPCDLDRLAVLIPAWQPGAALISLIEDLLSLGITTILVVDDGSDARSSAVFEQLQQFAPVRILHHQRNRGKGRALKTGLSYILEQIPLIEGTITADADGQHTAADILRAGCALSAAKKTIVLGVRAFDTAVPLRCRAGNLLTRHLFRWVTGADLSDTQSGLRALPRHLLAELHDLPGERYEYEMTVLAHLCRPDRPPLELPVATVYLDGNRSSHFHPLRDSLRVCLALLRVLTSRRSASTS